MRPVDIRYEVSQFFAEMPTAGVLASWVVNTVGWYVRLYGNYQPFGHAGMDFACPVGTRVYAMADGVVLYAGWGYNLPGTGSVRKWLLYKDFPGIVTVIQHDGWIGVYAHLSDNGMAPAGTRVKAGQLIALSGNTGGVAAHLHVEALVDLSYKTGDGLIYGRTDPRKYFGSGALAPQGEITTVQEDDMAWSFEDKVFLQNELERRRLASMGETKELLAEGFHNLKLFIQNDSENREVVTRASLDEKLTEIHAELVEKLAELDKEGV
jgi:murein DD-endopeptidase MepM/ murein hydrolase activator NlpD